MKSFRGENLKEELDYLKAYVLFHEVVTREARLGPCHFPSSPVALPNPLIWEQFNLVTSHRYLPHTPGPNLILNGVLWGQCESVSPCWASHRLQWDRDHWKSHWDLFFSHVGLQITCALPSYFSPSNVVLPSVSPDILASKVLQTFQGLGLWTLNSNNSNDSLVPSAISIHADHHQHFCDSIINNEICESHVVTFVYFSQSSQSCMLGYKHFLTPILTIRSPKNFHLPWVTRI